MPIAFGCPARVHRVSGLRVRRKTFFAKLAKYIGRGIKALLERPDGRYCFRLHRDRVYYVSEEQAKLAAGMPRKQLIGFGTSFGKFTKGKKFRLHVTCLDYVAQHAQHKIWLKPSAEQSFLYGNNVLKAVRRAACPPPSERRPEWRRRRLRRAWAGSRRTRRSTRAS